MFAEKDSAVNYSVPDLRNSDFDFDSGFVACSLQNSEVCLFHRNMNPPAKTVNANHVADPSCLSPVFASL